VVRSGSIEFVSEHVGNVRLEDVRALIRRLAELHIAKHGDAPNAIVAVGGTAMAAHRVRGASFDVDLYMRRKRDARLVILLEPAIRRVADTIGPHPSRSAQLVFDVVASGASEQLREIAASRPDLVTAISARVLKETAPDRFKKWADECALPDAAHLSTRGDTGQHGGGASEAGKP
jgi:hypothetical protein